MGLVGNQLRVRTISTVHFTGAIAAAGASAVEHLKTKQEAGATNGVVPEGLAAGRHMRSILKAVRILSVQNLDWEIELYRSAVGIGGAVIDAESFMGAVSFVVADGKKDTGDTYFEYYRDGIAIPYEDTDMAGQVHIRLVNHAAATAKIAGASGGIVIELSFEPAQGR